MISTQPLSNGFTAILIMRAFAELIRADVELARGKFGLLYARVRSFRVREGCREPRTCEDICRAVDLACVFYFKEVRCLQRSAATTTLLRKNGISAEMVIGVRQCPFRAHAWVEVAGRTVNDKPYTPTMYAVLDRC